VGPPRLRHNLKTSEKIEGAINNGQYRDTGNIGHTKTQNEKKKTTQQGKLKI